MPIYRVTWENDVEAASPVAAAEDALRQLREYEDAGWVWKIQRNRNGRLVGREQEIDLDVERANHAAHLALDVVDLLNDAKGG